MEKVDTVVHQCSYCCKQFKKESSLLVHVCEPKRRYQQRNDVGVQIGLQAYLQFYRQAQGQTTKTFDDFVKSPYYRAFVKFGQHCQAINAVNIERYIQWLIQNNKKIDYWCRDSVYEEYLLKHVFEENSIDAVARAFKAGIDWQEKNQNPAQDYLRYGNRNAIVYAITTGRISGWVLYNCASGQALLESLNSEQLAMVWPWVNPDQWTQKLHDYPAEANEAKTLLQQAGW